MSSPGRAISTNFRPAAYPDKTAEKHCQKNVMRQKNHSQCKFILDNIFFLLYKTQVYRQTVAQVAQLVEQRTENPRVGGSIPSLSTIYFKAW